MRAARCTGDRRSRRAAPGRVRPRGRPDGQRGRIVPHGPDQPAPEVARHVGLGGHEHHAVPETLHECRAGRGDRSVVTSSNAVSARSRPARSSRLTSAVECVRSANPTTMSTMLYSEAAVPSASSDARRAPDVRDARRPASGAWRAGTPPGRRGTQQDARARSRPRLLGPSSCERSARSRPRPPVTWRFRRAREVQRQLGTDQLRHAPDERERLDVRRHEAALARLGSGNPQARRTRRMSATLTPGGAGHLLGVVREPRTDQLGELAGRAPPRWGRGQHPRPRVPCHHLVQQGALRVGIACGWIAHDPQQPDARGRRVIPARSCPRRRRATRPRRERRR